MRSLRPLANKSTQRPPAPSPFSDSHQKSPPANTDSPSQSLPSAAHSSATASAT